jgi:type I restriction enzyme S subunit
VTIDVSLPRARTGWLKNFVPKGWKLARLGDEADARLGKMLDKEKNRGELFPYLANPNVRWFEFDLSNLK